MESQDHCQCHDHGHEPAECKSPITHPEDNMCDYSPRQRGGRLDSDPLAEDAMCPFLIHDWLPRSLRFL
jgi:hypothetical protein